MLVRCRAIFIAVFALFLLGCQEDGPEIVDSGDPREQLLAEQKAACLKDGGRWGAGGPGGLFVCYTPLSDANKRCDIGTDCKGLCLARSRSCAPLKPFFGCHEVITDGGLPATVCVE